MSNENQPTENLTPLTRRCVHCGEVKPIGEFYKNRSRKDGYQVTCKDCQRGYNRAYYRVRSQASQNGGYDSETAPLAKFTPRELIAELRRRGYKGELKFTQTIKV